MSDERRRNPRHDLLAHVRVKRGTMNYVLEVRNLSLSGAFVSLAGLSRELPFGIGQAVEMNLFLAREMENLKVHGRVVRTVDAEDEMERGFGAAFLDIDPATEARIAQLIQAAKSTDAPSSCADGTQAP